MSAPCTHSREECADALDVDGLCAYCLRDDAAKLRAENRELRRRVRLARPKLSQEERDDLKDYVRYYIDVRRVKGEWWRVATAVRSLLTAADLLDLRKPLPKRGRR